MTQIEYARKNKITPLVNAVSRLEGVSARQILTGLKDASIVIPLNRLRKIKKPCAIGRGMRTKVNANLGTSTDRTSMKGEAEKLAVALKYGADTVMDLSVGDAIASTRRYIVRNSCVPVGTVPIYEVAVGAQKKENDLLSFDISDILRVLEAQAKDGVDFFTIHAGVTRKSLKALYSRKRVLGIVSRGGAILASWIKRCGRENPFFENFDRILDIAAEYDITISLGDALRPGSILDSTDPGQIAELEELGKLALRCRKRGVQVMIEGPGHVPLDQIKENIELQKKICRNAPFYVLGPLVTDIAAGYDHINSAIGGAIAASFGADFLCYVTPSEHLRHPSLDDVREGVIASRIAAHAADIVKGVRSALLRDKEMSLARSRRDWKRQIALSIDPQKAGDYRASSKPGESDVCTMCGKYCSIKLSESCLSR